MILSVCVCGGGGGQNISEGDRIFQSATGIVCGGRNILSHVVVIKYEQVHTRVCQSPCMHTHTHGMFSWWQRSTVRTNLGYVCICVCLQ